MKYRIKIITFLNGRQEFFAQHRKLFYWTDLGCEGAEGYASSERRIEDAIERINLHFLGNKKIIKTEFKYIIK